MDGNCSNKEDMGVQGLLKKRMALTLIDSVREWHKS